MRDYRDQADPERSSTPPTPGGCIEVAVIGAVALGTLYFLIHIAAWVVLDLLGELT